MYAWGKKGIIPSQWITETLWDNNVHIRNTFVYATRTFLAFR